MKSKFPKILLIILMVVLFAALITEAVLLYGCNDSEESETSEETFFSYYCEDPV
ncbi:MAG: hypothetical protein LUI60_07155 [Clostridia bacterium]|nr:hypothetical protein [Clostridia bacterium]